MPARWTSKMLPSGPDAVTAECDPFRAGMLPALQSLRRSRRVPVLFAEVSGVGEDRCFSGGGHAAVCNNIKSSISSNITPIAEGNATRVADLVAHPNAPAPEQQGSDLVVAKLSRRPANANPMEISETPPAIGEVVEIAGFGQPYVPNVPLTAAGELLGGNAPVHNRTDPQSNIALTTLF